MIWSKALTWEDQTDSCNCLQDDPATASFTCYRLNGGEQLTLPARQDSVRILFLCKGSVQANETALKEKGVYIGTPGKELSLTAKENCLALEICRWVTPEEFGELDMSAFPYALDYDRAATYTEECKSPKTISRMLIPARIVPRFAMGSVQTQGVDRVDPHCHPDLDQYFYGLAENDCFAMIDGQPFHFGGSTLMHIPLGSHHGVILEEQHVCHYLWIDFLLNQKGLEYLDRAHVETKNP